MLHLIYILAFTILAFLAVGNLIRNLMLLGMESQRSYGNQGRFNPRASQVGGRSNPHPELLDERGNLVNEPFLVMRSMTVEDAREHLDELYKASPGYTDGAHDEAQG
jgi:AAA+ ATPase superfamily predicted ATPase